MTPNIFKKIIYHLKMIVHNVVWAQDRFIAEGSHSVINLRSIITIIIQQKGSKMYTCMAGTSNLTWSNC